MPDTVPHILVVDDEPHNIDIIFEYLEQGNYRLSEAENGEVAWQILESDPESFDVVLLDRMMPKMGGMEVLEKIDNHPVLKFCPVILQTARVAKKDMLEGIRAGAYYYLTKPFEADMLYSVVETAVRYRMQYKDLQNKLENHHSCLNLMDQASFGFQNLGQIHSLATLVAKACPNPTSVVMGLSELMINAVEHGNLGITYQEKSSLNKQGCWEEEVEKRLAGTLFKEKRATLEFSRGENEINIIIKDQGNGFDWEPYLQMSADRITDSHGRGIALAKLLSFSSINYQGNGNEVHVAIEYSK